MSKTRESKGRVEAQRSSGQKTSPTKRARETSMVQVSQTLSVKLMRADTALKQQKTKKTTSDLSLVSGYETKHKDKKCRMNRAVPSSSSTQNIDEQTGGKSALDPNCNQSDVSMDKGEEFGAAQLVPQSPPPAKGWVILPFFQSFKSKMASFTDIVMSPVRLFKPTHPSSSTPPDSPTQPDPDSEHSVSMETDFNKQLGEVEGNVEEGSTAGTDPVSPQSQGQSEDAAGDFSCQSRDSGLGDWQTTHFETRVRAERSAAEHGTAVQKSSVVRKCSFDTLKTHSLPEEDECTFEGRQTGNSMLTSDDTMLFTMTEKETKNNDSVPCMPRSQLVKSSFEQSPESTQFSSSSSSLSNTSASHGSELNPNVETEEQMSLTAAQRRPLQRKRGRNKSKAKSSSSETPASSEISCDSTTVSGLSTTDLPDAEGISEPRGEEISLKYTKTEICHSSDNDTSSPLSSFDYRSPPVSLCLAVDGGESDGGLHENDSVSVCRSHVSVRRSRRKAVTVNNTVSNLGTASSEPLQKPLLDGEGKQGVVVSAKGKRRLKAAALLDAGRNSEKRKREMRKGKTVEEVEEKESVIHAGFQSSTSEISEHKEFTEPFGPRASSNRQGAKSQLLHCFNLPTQSCSSTVMDLKAIEEPIEMSVPVIEGSRETGSGRKGRGKQGATLTERVTSSAIGPGDTADNGCVGSLSEGNSRSTRKRNKFTDGRDCFSSTKRLKEKSVACLSRSESESNAAGDMELETTVTASIVKASLKGQAPEGLVQHSDAKGRPRTSNVQKKGAIKKRKVDDVIGPHQNRRKCAKSDLALVVDERSMTLTPGADPELPVQLNEREVERLTDSQGNDSTERVEEVSSSSYGPNETVDEMMEEEQEEKRTELLGVKGAAEVRHCKRETRKKPRKAETQKRKHRALALGGDKEEKEVEGKVKEEEHGAPGEETDLARGADSSDDLSRHLQRSHSCPEIPSLRHHDSPWSPAWPTPHRGRAHRHPSPCVPAAAAHFPKSFRRARRHTVCSVEVEREIPPRCLRKEVYPTRRSAPPLYGKADRPSPRAPASPSSFSAQASCFMSSPLAFLSKKTDRKGLACNYVATYSSPSVFASPPLPSCSSAWSAFPGSSPRSLPRLDLSSASVTSLCSALSKIPLEGGNESRQPSEEEYGEDNNSCSSQEFESMGMGEEKALSDSEIKTGSSKHEKQGKVSSIRIRRSIPKPQNNLTPMGLPRTVRLKKKEFSLEEIYTNKNFNKPPEGRLETIFEVPLNRRNGSQSLIGLKRVKRYVEFPEVGGTRKPRKSLGAGKAGSSRPRRGGYPNSKDDPSLSPQELDSLLSSKLDQLDYWLALDQDNP